jgi:hypothetical protein
LAGPARRDRYLQSEIRMSLRAPDKVILESLIIRWPGAPVRKARGH